MNPTLRRRILFWAPFVLLVLVVLVFLFRPQPVPVDLVAVSRGPLMVSVIDEGETRVRDVFVVSAPIPGLMRRIELEAGDRVEAQKTVIARIEASDPAFLDRRMEAEARAARDAAAAARSHARAQLERAEAEREFAAVEFERIQSLAAQQSISRNERDAAERRVKAAIAQVEEAKAALAMRESEYQQAQARLLSPSRIRGRDEECDCVLVRSPISGTVLRVINESEQIVQSGQPLVELGDPTNLEIVVDLLSADAVRVQPGQRVIIEGWGGDGTLEGVVRRVEPFGFLKISALGIEEQRVNVIIDLTDPVERWERLGHGYRVEPRIVLWEGTDVLQVPLSAVFREGDDWAVFVHENGRAVLRKIEIGAQNGLQVQILSGLEAGEMIVLHPSDRIADGTRIEQRA